MRMVVFAAKKHGSKPLDKIYIAVQLHMVNLIPVTDSFIRMLSCQSQFVVTLCRIAHHRKSVILHKQYSFPPQDSPNFDHGFHVRHFQIPRGDPH